MHSEYSRQFLDSLHYLEEFDKEYKKSKPNYEQASKIILENRIGIEKQTNEEVSKKILKPYCEDYLIRLSEIRKLSNSCHALSHSFNMEWNDLVLDDVEFGMELPLTVTIGNIIHKKENIYKLSKTSLKRIINEGQQPGKTLDVHVWLTLPDMSVLDLSIISTLIKRKKINMPVNGSLALLWREEEPGDYMYEPLLADNNFFYKVDGCSR